MTHASVEHCDDDVTRCGKYIPTFWSVDVSIRFSGRAIDGLAGIVQPPQLLIHKKGVIRVGARKVPEVIGLGINDQSTLHIDGDQVCDRLTDRNFEDLQAANIAECPQDRNLLPGMETG